MTRTNRPPIKIRTPNSLLWNILLILLAVGFMLAAAFFPVLARAESIAPPAALIAQLRKMTKDDGVPGITVLVFRRGQLLYRADEGDIAPHEELPVASASKWLTVALVMTVVDEGKLSLDEPIGRRLPDFAGTAGAITLRQLLSFTSGQGSLRGLVDVRQDPRMALAESAHQIAQIPLQDPPGTVFKYGSPALQVAGALVEQATGKTWAQLFEERLAGPLGMSHTVWANPLWPNIAPDQVHNPNLQGGAITTAEDYGRFLTMLAANGVYQGHRILSVQSVNAMEHAQTRGMSMAFVPQGGAESGLQYALGNWCGAVGDNGDCTLVASPGALGTYPWIDRNNGLYGIFFMRRRMPLVEKDIQAARHIIEQAASSLP
ncbi:MAG TPA: serine hydrolase domain-containing protein [Rhizomicrobium sp.]|jgi:CubicO group peptidase (beta-lactamase class C family)